MPSTPLLLDEWTEEQIARLDSANLVASHRLAKLDLFSDEGLIETLAAHPEHALGVNTMGEDPNRPEEWREGLRDGHDAATMLEAVKQGRLWLNLRRVMDHHADYRDLINNLYDELESIKPGLKTFNRTANLLVSSPTALVYYHVDCPVNMLWHIRGAKRVWVYPLETGVVSDETREAVLSGESAEEIAYSPELDDLAEVYDLEPGQLITWPQHTPHRVVNTSGLNISLSTEHMTREACRLNNVYLANRHFRKLFGGGFRSTELTGFGAWAKEAAIRLARRVPSFAPEVLKGYDYPVTFALDPTAPDGVRLLDDRSQPGGADQALPADDAAAEAAGAPPAKPVVLGGTGEAVVDSPVPTI
ncbi:MAG: hypothetical protein AAF790_06675 [Planctomycetota bacterium]